MSVESAAGIERPAGIESAAGMENVESAAALVCGFAIGEDGPNRGRVRALPTPTEEVRPGEWIWLHFDRGASATERWLRKESHLSDPLVDALLDEETRPRHALFDDGALVILRAVNLNPGAEAHDMLSLRMFVSDDLVVTLRRHTVFAVADIRARYEAACADDARSSGPDSPAHLFGAVVEGLTDRIAETVAGLEDDLDALEERMVETDPETLRADVLRLRRRALPLKRFLAPQREALAAFSKARVHFLSDEVRTLVAEEAERTVRLVEALDALRERAGLLQEEITATIDDRINRNTYSLSLVAAIFLPLGFLTGLLGINVGGMPGADTPWAFWAVVALCIVLSVVGVWMLKRLRLL